MIALVLFSIGCNQNVGEFEVNSPKAISNLRTDLLFVEVDIAKDVHYWAQINSSSVARFVTDSYTVFRVIERFQMEKDTIGKYIWIPEESPGWFGPSIDPEDQKKYTWIKFFAERKNILFLCKSEMAAINDYTITQSSLKSYVSYLKAKRSYF